MSKEITLTELAERIDRLVEQLDSFQVSATTTDDEGISVPEAAKIAGVSPGTMRAWVDAKYVPSFKVVGCVRISRRALSEWLYEKSNERARVDAC